MKKALALILLVVLCLSLAACTASKDDLVGTWSGSWEYEGNLFVETFTLTENGTYTSTLYKNGNLNKTESGTYEIDGNTVDLHPTGEGSWTSYDYKGGKLINNDHEFTKR